MRPVQSSLPKNKTTTEKGARPMSKNLKDQMVETEDMLFDCMDKAAYENSYSQICFDTDEFIKEFQSRGKSVQFHAILDLVGVKTFSELEQYFKEEIQ
jgi:phage gp29-like protein